jgi:hypothetical protein
MALLHHPLAVPMLGVLEEGSERLPVLLALLPWLAGRQGVLVFAAMTRLRHRRQRPTSVSLGKALFSRRPNHLEVAAVSSGAGDCVRVRQPFCHRLPLGMHEIQSYLIAASRLERREQSSLLCDSLLGRRVIWQADVELVVIVLIILARLRWRRWWRWW